MNKEDINWPVEGNNNNELLDRASTKENNDHLWVKRWLLISENVIEFLLEVDLLEYHLSTSVAESFISFETLFYKGIQQMCKALF